MPGELIDELEQTRKVLPRRCPAAAVLSCDFPGFSAAGDTLEPFDAGRRLQRLAVACEEIAGRHRLETTSAGGGSLLAVAGLFGNSAQPALDAVRCALEIRDAVCGLEADWPPRSGIHCGPVVAGVLGHRKVRFDLWGPTVTSAARVKRSGPPGAVHVSDALWRQVGEYCEGRRLGEVKLDGGGTVAVYRVDRLSV